MPQTFVPDMLALPTTLQFVPPSVVRITPMRAPPCPPSELVLPMPATSVLLVASVGSNSTLPIDSEPRESVWGVHVGADTVAFVVFHIPPFTIPTYKTEALPG